MRIGEIKIYLFAIGLISTYVVMVLIGEHRIRASAETSNRGNITFEQFDPYLVSDTSFKRDADEIDSPGKKQLSEIQLIKQRVLKRFESNEILSMTSSDQDVDLPPTPLEYESSASVAAPTNQPPIYENHSIAIELKQPQTNASGSVVNQKHDTVPKYSGNDTENSKIDKHTNVGSFAHHTARIPTELQSVLDRSIIDTNKQGSASEVGRNDHSNQQVTISNLHDTSNSASDNSVVLTDARLKDAEVPETELPKLLRWPRSEQLHGTLAQLENFEITYPWSLQTKEILKRLEQTAIGPKTNAKITIAQLASAQQELDRIINAVPRQNLQSPAWQELFAQMVRVRFELHRRVQIWSQVAELLDIYVSETPDPNSSAVVNASLVSSGNLQNYTNNEQWRQYLELEKIAKIFGGEKYNAKHRSIVARKVLARATSPMLTDEQYQFAKDVLGERLFEQLQDSATHAVDYHNLLTQLEAFEEKPMGIGSHRFTNEYLNLYFSRTPQYRGLAETINNIYRNANIRFSVSSELLNRALPSQPESREPVTDRILGAQVFGNNRIRNRLQIQFVPDPEKLNFRLMTTGSVLSRTRALHSGFTFHNTGNSRFQGISDITVSKQGVFANSANVSASTNQHLTGIRSNMDNIPLLGWAARQLAEQQQRNSVPVANRLVEEKLKNLTKSRVDDEIQKQLADAQAMFIQRLLNPLNALELEPTPVELRTTNNEAIVRYRIASREQMAAFSARPQAIPGNLLSMQIHESALNNILNKIDINGKKFTAEEFTAHLQEVIGQNELFGTNSKSNNRDAKFTFAPLDGIHIRFVDGMLRISLNLKQLRLGNTQQWKNFKVSANYVPVVDGLNVRFVQDQLRGITLSESRFGVADELSLQTIFGSAFPEKFAIPSMTQMLPSSLPISDLHISQLVFTHGWMGLSLSPNAKSQTQAIRNANRGRFIR